VVCGRVWLCARVWQAWLPIGGMNKDVRARCTNDHLLFCPRALCRAYFRLLELWTSPHCRATYRRHSKSNSTADATSGSPSATIFATPTAVGAAGDEPTAHAGRLTMNGLPTAPFVLPPPPRGELPEYYIRARYSRGAACTAATSDEECCGLLRELAYPYAIARGDAQRGYVACDANLRQEWRPDALAAAGGNRGVMLP
jgi:hypothetical protein